MRASAKLAATATAALISQTTTDTGNFTAAASAATCRCGAKMVVNSAPLLLLRRREDSMDFDWVLAQWCLSIWNPSLMDWVPDNTAAACYAL